MYTYVYACGCSYVYMFTQRDAALRRTPLSASRAEGSVLHQKLRTVFHRYSDV